MNALNLHLANRDCADARVKWLNAIRGLPGPVSRWAERRVWRGPMKHMRSIPPGIHVEIDSHGSWSYKKLGNRLATGIPLDQLIGRIDRPVTIVATGPSAIGYPWDAVRQGERLLVAVNGAPTFLEKMGIMPELLVVTDQNFSASGLEHFQNAQGVPLVTTCKAAAVLAADSPAELCNRAFSIIERVNGWYGVPAVSLVRLYEINAASGSPFHFPDQDLQFKVGWSDTPENGFFSACNVVFAALQVVVGLGATDIEIVGMDLSDQGRVYDEGSNPRPSGLLAQYQQYILPSFEVMHRALTGSGVKIRNLSPVCPLPAELFIL